MENEIPIDLSETGRGNYLARDLLYNAVQLNEHLAKELSNLQEENNSKITARAIELATATAVITSLAELHLSDADTIIQNRVGH